VCEEESSDSQTPRRSDAGLTPAGALPMIVRERAKRRLMEHAPYSRSELLSALQGKDLGGVPATFYELNPHRKDSWYCQNPAYSTLVEFAAQSADTFALAGVGMGMFLSDDSLLDKETRKERQDGRTFTTTIVHTPRGDLVRRSRRDDDVLTEWLFEHFLKTEEDVEAFLSLPYEPPRLDFSDYRKCEQSTGEKGLLVADLPDPICVVMDLVGFMQVALWCRTNPELVIRLVEVISERLTWAVAEIARQVERSGFRIFGPEYAAPPLLSAEWFEKLVVPHDKKMVEIVRNSGRSNIAILHCHGHLDAVLEKILRIGPHALEPLEPPPLGNLTMKELRRRVGDNLVLMGYMQARELEFDTEEETERKARQAIEDGYRNGGLVLLPTAFPISTPVSPRCERNLMRFVMTAKEGAF